MTLNLYISLTGLHGYPKKFTAQRTVPGIIEDFQILVCGCILISKVISVCSLSVLNKYEVMQQYAFPVTIIKPLTRPDFVNYGSWIDKFSLHILIKLTRSFVFLRTAELREILQK